MKNIIFIIAFTSLLFSCSSDSNNNPINNNPSNNGNSFTNSMDYEFTITINGEVHKVKGNTTNGIPKGISASSYVNNECEVLDAAGQKTVLLKINDVTATNFISGQNLECRISLPNLLMGINQAQIVFIGSYFDTLYTSLSSSYFTPGAAFWYFQTVNGAFNSANYSKLPINITDLGTGTIYPQTYPLPLYNFGQTLKGNYSGTIYLKRQLTNDGSLVCDIPVQLSIDFKALRMY